MRVRRAVRRNGAVRVRRAVRRNGTVRALAVAAVMVTGCSYQSPGPQRGSVGSCIQFGISAIRHHVTVTSAPAACRGLTRAQVNFAAGSALHTVADTARGKVRRRELAVTLGPLLAHLVTKVPQQRRPAPVGQAPAAHEAGRTQLGLAALVTWLITISLGLSMMARWIARGGLRRARADPAALPPSVILTHAGLGATGLLAWIAFLATGLAGVAWIAVALLLAVTGAGIALVSLWLPERSLTAATVPPSQAVPGGAGPASVRLLNEAPESRHPPVLIIAAHGVCAVATMLFALLAAVGAR